MSKPLRSPKYLKYIREQRCIITERPSDSSTIHAHHIRWKSGAGSGQKPHDYFCLPLYHEEHDLLHNKGEKSYWTDKNIDPHREICMKLFAYLYYTHNDDFRNLAEKLAHFIDSQKIQL